jgi:uncharacterized protein
MAGIFELFLDSESHFRFRLKAPDGTVMAVSRGFHDKAAAVAGISAVREYAGMGLISDLCPKSTGNGAGRSESGRSQFEQVPHGPRDESEERAPAAAGSPSPGAPLQAPPAPALRMVRRRRSVVMAERYRTH